MNESTAMERLREMADRDLQTKKDIYKAIKWIKTRQIAGLIFSFFIMLGVLLGYLTIVQDSKNQEKAIKLMEHSIKNQDTAIGTFLEIIKDLKETK